MTTYTLETASESDLVGCDYDGVPEPPYCWREFEQIGAGASKMAALQDSDSSTGIRNYDASTPTYDGPYGKQGFYVDELPAATPANAAILGVRVKLCGVRAGAPTDVTVTVGVGRDGQTSTAKWEEFTLASDDPTVYELDFTARGPAGKAEGATWAVEDVNRLQVVLMTGWPYPRISRLYVEVDVQTSASQNPGVEAARAVASRHLRQYRRPLPYATVTTRLGKGLKARLGEVVGLTHEAMPHPEGEGAGPEPWQRWRGRIIRKTVSPSKDTVTLLLRAVKHFLLGLWYRAHGRLSGIDTEEGVARILTGQRWVFTRDSSAWIADPAGGQVISIASNAPKLDRDGHLMERASTNVLRNSSAAEGISSDWTTGGTVTAETDAARLLFAADVTDTAWKLAASGSIEQTADDPGTVTETEWTLSVDHEDADATKPPTWRVQRSVDSKWYKASNATWDASEQANAMTGSTSSTRLVATFDAGASPGTLTVRVVAGSDAAWVQHVQLENLPWASSRIVTGDDPATRAADRLAVSNDSSARCLNVDHGTARLVWAPLFDSDAVPGYTMRLLYLAFDPSNILTVVFDGTAEAFYFTRTVGGALTATSVAASFSRGDEVAVVARWTGERGELGLDPFTADVFVNGTKGSSVAASGPLSEGASATVELGSGASAWAEGAIRTVLLTPQVLTDGECGRAD